MNVSEYISSTKMSSDYKPRVALAILHYNNAATLKNISDLTGIDAKVLKNMPLKVMTQNGVLICVNGSYSLTVEIDVDAVESCHKRLCAFHGEEYEAPCSVAFYDVEVAA